MAANRQDLGPKIGLVLTALNASRGRVARELGVDKSLVGRWASGRVVPSAHSLERLTALVRRRLSGFSLAFWDLATPEFRAAIGLPAGKERMPEHESHDAGEGWQPSIAGRARHELSRFGQAYPGFYRLFRLALSNSGTLLVGGVEIARRDDELLIRYSDGLLSYRGSLYLLNGQVFGVMGECKERDRMMFLVLNGVPARRAMQLDGLIASVAGDKSHTPTATTAVLLRERDLFADPVSNEAYWQDAVRFALRTNRDGAAGELLSEPLKALLANQVGPRAAAGPFDSVLRLPPERSQSRGVGAPFPDIEAAAALGGPSP